MSTELENLIRKLLTRREVFFDKTNVLNSDGRRLLNKIIRMVLREYPELRKLVSKTRKNPTLENVIKLAEEITHMRELKSHTQR
jgi:hypothetical protein